MTHKHIEVAAAIICVDNQFLLSKRLDHLHQGGKWEFPGGKIEQGETPEQALSRELKEELDITPENMRNFEKLTYDYPEKKVTLHFIWVSKISGEPRGVEQQPVAWVSASKLAELRFPDANEPIVKKILQLY